MEQTLQEQTSGCHSYCFRFMSSPVGKGACVAFIGQKKNPLQAADIAQLVELVQERNARMKVWYYVPQSLCHYGKVDSLATAGAMQDFVDYVQELEHKEALAFYQDVKKALGSHDFEVSVVHELSAWEKESKTFYSEFAEVVLGMPHTL